MQRTAIFYCLMLAAATAASGCGMSAPTDLTAPTLMSSRVKPPPPPLPEAMPFNRPPTIRSLTLSSPRVEAGEDVRVTATVEDVETPVDRLLYEWSATPARGTLSSAGRQLTWKAPPLQPTPDAYALTLTVIERYTLKGLENRASRSVEVHYNDSYREITRIGLRFLTELFPTYSVPAQQAVQDFSDTCPGKAFEFSDVANNRINFHILSGTYTDIAISLDPTKTYAEVSGTCVFHDIPMNPADPNFGRRESVTGICTLTAIYENWRWFLCDSHIRGIPPGVMLESLRYRVPGRIIWP